VLEEVLGHPRIAGVGRCIADVDVNMNNRFSLRWIRAIGHSGRMRQAKQSKGTRFGSLNRVAFKDAQVATSSQDGRWNWNPWGFHNTVSMLCLVAMVLFATSDAFSPLAIHIRL
jgi:hypothetical protein